MKTKMNVRFGLRFFMWAMILAGPALHAAAPSAMSGYAKAVQVYVEAAATEMRAIRGEVDSAKAKIGEPGRKVWEEIYPDLDQCDALVEQLRTATPRNFDPLKAKFERTRAGVTEALAGVRAAAKT